MLFLVPAVCTRAQDITIYSIPSPKGINWKSPNGLVFSYVSNIFCSSRYRKNKHPIGHMMVELKDSSRHALVGVTSIAGSGMSKKVILKGYGLGILFTTINGKLEEEDKNIPQVQQRCETGDIAFITYKIDQLVFNRLWQYLQEYKEKGYPRFYNGWNKPREGLGAGCSAFAVSFLEIGGLSHVLPANEWCVEVAVPRRLIGGRVVASYVQLIKLLFAKRWAANSNTTCMPLSLYEPTLLYNWIKKTHGSAITMETIQKTSIGKAPGLIIDCSHIRPPDEPIWKNPETVIEKEY